MRFSKLGFLAAVIAATASCSNGTSTGGLDVEQTYIINLAQANEVPTPKPTNASGGAAVLVYASRIDFQLSAINITGITMAHIHSGALGVAGPVVVTLFLPGSPTGNVSGVFAVGSLDASNLPSGVTLESLKTLLLSGNAYINVHTVANPTGEIRGQLVQGVPTAAQ
jgi:hypothetical protein